jgi:hypothetical protein
MQITVDVDNLIAVGTYDFSRHDKPGEKVKGAIEAKLSEDGQTMKGFWKQGLGEKGYFDFRLTNDNTLEGIWSESYKVDRRSGEYKVDGQKGKWLGTRK